MADPKGKDRRPKRLTTAGDQRPKRVPPTVERPGQRAAVQVPAPFTPEFFAEVNKGPLERAYEERQRDPKTWNPIPWGRVAIGVLIGLVFAYVNIFAVLAAGFTVGGSWYLTYFLGTASRWRPGVINYVAGASTGASQVVIGIAFVLPALFFLSDRGPFNAFSFNEVPSPWALAGFFLVGGLFGVIFFQFYRRVWVVERPLQYPGGFESTMELLSIADAQKPEDRARARRSILMVWVAAAAAAMFVFMRDLAWLGRPGAQRSLLDAAFGGRFYSGGFVPNFPVFRPLYGGFLFLDPFFLAIGWFVRTRIAGIILIGSFLTFFLPFFGSSGASAEDLRFIWAVNRRTLAAGAILGAGLVALVRLRSILGSGIRAIFTPDPARGTHFVSRRLMIGGIVVGLVVASGLLVIGGISIAAALLVVPLAALLVGVLGLVAVKVTGETAVQAVSPMTIIAIIALLLVLQLVGFGGAALLVLALGSAAFFATGVVMSTDMFLDSKVALYVDNPPHRQALVQIAGLVPGVLLGTAVVWYLSGQIVEGTAQAISAPFGAAFAGLSLGFTGGEFDWSLFIIAAGLGAMIELATGLGTAFGIGMALELWAPMTLFAGGLLRGAYERFLAPSADAQDSGMVTRVALPTGLFVGASLAALLVFVLHQFVL